MAKRYCESSNISSISTRRWKGNPMRWAVLILLSGVVLLIYASSIAIASSRTGISTSTSNLKQTSASNANQSSAPSTSATPVPKSLASRCLDVAYKLVICSIGIGGTIGFFSVGIRYFRELKKTMTNMNSFIDDVRPDLDCYKKMAKTVNEFMRKVLPTVLRGLEDQKIVETGCEKSLIEIISSPYITPDSAKQLNDSGMDLLKNSQMQKIIDANLDSLIQKLEKQNLKSLFDVEVHSLCILRRMKDEKAITFLKNYIYNNPEKNINDILFVGSIYLRNKYAESHPKILEEVELDL